MIGTRREDGPPQSTRRDGIPARRGTRREADGVPPGTRREADGVPPGTRREGTAPAASPTFVRGLPPRLDAIYVVVEEIAASGSEADVVVVRHRETDERFVIKLYRRGVQPDQDALTRLAAADPDHVVDVIESGSDAGSWFEVLEFCEHGSLRSLMRDGPRPCVADVVRELCTALTHVHGLHLVHRDLKPENVLVRRVSPLDLVLGDFGLVRTMEGSVRYTRAWGTPAYSPPEFAGGEVSDAWDWWSLGMIIAELAGGRHPFESADGVMMSDQQIQAWLPQRAVDLSAVEDPRIALLCRGLLTRDRRHRWGTQQVDEWLAGGSPPVVADRETTIPGARTRRVLFAGRECSDPVQLAAALQERWPEALRRLYQERDQGLLDEIERLLRAHELAEATRLLAPPASSRDLPRRLADLLVELDPELDPVFNGIRLTSTGLQQTAADVVSAAGTQPAVRTLDEVLQARILVLWRDLPGMTHGPATHEAWTTSLAELEQRFRSLAGVGFTPTDEDRAVARAWLLLCALDPARWVAELQLQLEDLATPEAVRQPWWRAFSEPGAGPVDLVAAYVAQRHARERTAAEDERARQEAEAEERRRQEEEDRRREEADRLRNLARARYRAGDRRLFRWLAVLCCTVAPAVGAGFLIVRDHFPATSIYNDLGAMLEAKWLPVLLYLWLVGAGALAALAGAVLLLRGRWWHRGAATVVALLLLAGGAALVLNRETMGDGVLKDSRQAFRTVAMPTDRIAGYCSTYSTWTGTARPTRAVVAGENCNSVVRYDGWFQSWEFPLQRPITDFASIKGTYVLTNEGSSVVIALDGETGAELWRKTCKDGWYLDLSLSDAGESTPGVQTLGAQCGSYGDPLTLDPVTGKRA